MKLAFVGMSHLGLVYSTVAASMGNHVVCFDEDEFLINNLSELVLPIYEPGLDTLVDKYRKNLTFTTDLNKIKQAELIFISLDIVTDSNNESNLDAINKIIKTVSPVIGANSSLVILSQVSPGFTAKIAGSVDFEVFYQVETLVFGEAVNRARNPERIIVGMASNSKIDKNLEDYFSKFNAPVLKMNYESAELAKMSINFLLATSVTATNTLASLARSLNADWADIKKVIDLDARIGEKAYTKPGLGLSGGNIERDVKNISNLLAIDQIDTSLCDVIFSTSNQAKLWPSKIVDTLIKNGVKIEKITFWGLTYKQSTNSMKNSPAFDNLKALQTRFEIQVYDPYISAKELDLNICTEQIKSLENSDVLIIFNESKAYQNISISEISTYMRSNIIIDPFGVLDSSEPHSSILFTLKSGKQYLSSIFNFE